MIGGMTSLIVFGTDDHGPTITLGPDVEHVELHSDLSVTVVGPVPPYPGAKYPPLNAEKPRTPNQECGAFCF